MVTSTIYESWKILNGYQKCKAEDKQCQGQKKNRQKQKLWSTKYIIEVKD